jgi:SAM-dependent methyltransferase
MEPVALQYCRRRGITELVQASATALPFADGSFSGVVALDVLEHIPDDRAAAQEIARVLAPGGMLYVTVPAYRSLWSSHDVALMHQRRYVAQEVRDLLTGAGLEMVRLTYTVSFFLPLVWTIRMIRKRLKPKGAPRADVALTPRAVNGFLRAILDMESSLVLRAPLPFGLTVFAAARKLVRRD